MIKHIFLPISGSPSDESALDSAIALASAHGSPGDRHAIGAIADQARAEQGRGMQIVVLLRHAQAVAGVRHCVLGVAAV